MRKDHKCGFLSIPTAIVNADKTLQEALKSTDGTPVNLPSYEYPIYLRPQNSKRTPTNPKRISRKANGVRIQPSRQGKQAQPRWKIQPTNHINVDPLMNEIRQLKQSHDELEAKVTEISNTATQQISLLAQEVRQLTALVAQISSITLSHQSQPITDHKPLQELSLNPSASTFIPTLIQKADTHHSPDYANQKRPFSSPESFSDESCMTKFSPPMKPPFKKAKPSYLSQLQLQSLPTCPKQEMETRINQKLQDILTNFEAHERLRKKSLMILFDFGI